MKRASEKCYCQSLKLSLCIVGHVTVSDISHSAAEKLVSQRFESADLKDQQDMLASFIRHGVSRKQCEVEIPFQIIAGSDTTATAIRTTLLYLTTHQATYDRLRREIDDGISGGRISAPIKADEARKIPFLQVRDCPAPVLIHLKVLCN